jgi:hypothetical protein
MNTQDLDQLVQSTFAEINRLLVVKGGEYANSEDRLANFKRGAALTGATPLQVLFIYMSKHYDAVASFVQSSAKGQVRPSSEPIEGRLDDLINYCLLAKGLIGEMHTAGKGIVEASKDYVIKMQRLNVNPFAGVEAARRAPYGPTGLPNSDPQVGPSGQPLPTLRSMGGLGPEHC